MCSCCCHWCCWCCCRVVVVVIIVVVAVVVVVVCVVVFRSWFLLSQAIVGRGHVFLVQAIIGWCPASQSTV